MNLLPLPADRVLNIHKHMGLQYTAASDFKIGTPQPMFINACDMVFAWTGQVNKYGYYLYKSFAKYSFLIFR